MTDKVFVSSDYPGDLGRLDPSKVQEVIVEIDLEPRGGKLTWVLNEIQTTAPTSSVHQDPYYGWSLVVTADTIFRLQLSKRWLWRFLEPGEIVPPGPPIRFPSPYHAKFYGVHNQAGKSLELHARATGNPIKQAHKLNVYVAMEQDGGPELFLVIDPITENPRLLEYLLGL